MPKLEYRRTVVDLNGAPDPRFGAGIAGHVCCPSWNKRIIEGPIMAKILVVEDFPPIATLLVTLLRRRGHQISREQTIAGALRLKGFFDHAILDIDLPDGNGVMLAERLLDQRLIGSVVFFTATRDVALLSRAMSLGLLVDKAAGLNRLLDTIQQLTDSAATRHAAVVGSVRATTTRSSGRSGIIAGFP